MPLKRKTGERCREPKRGRRVSFAEIDTGVKASNCVKFFFVKSKEEVGNTNDSFNLNPLVLNQCFEADGTLYGYKDLKINIWLSMVSFKAYADIAFESSHDSGKGITNLKGALQDIFGETLVEKEQFLSSFSEEKNYIRDIALNGVTISFNSSGDAEHGSDKNLDSDNSVIEVIQMKLMNKPVRMLYNRLRPLGFLYMNGGGSVDDDNFPRWDIYLIVKKIEGLSSDCTVNLLGFATVRHFYHYPHSSRLRIAEILVFPPYRRKNFARILLESVNSVAILENFYDVATLAPTVYLQCRRVCIDIRRLLHFEPITQSISSTVTCLKENQSEKGYKTIYATFKSTLEIARQHLKIQKIQFLHCWKVLIYMNFDHEDQTSMDNFKNCVLVNFRDNVDEDERSNWMHLLEVPNRFGHNRTFVTYWHKDNVKSDDQADKLQEQQASQEQQNNELIQKEMSNISIIANKVISYLKQRC